MLEDGYKKLDTWNRDRCQKILNDWKGKAKNKLNTYKQALKSSIEDRNYTEWVLKEKLENEWLEREKVEKEK